MKKKNLRRFLEQWMEYQEEISTNFDPLEYDDEDVSYVTKSLLGEGKVMNKITKLGTTEV